VGVFLQNAVVLNPQRYLAGLWEASKLSAEHRRCRSTVTFEQRLVSSLEELQVEGAYDAIVVATGAAAGAIQEVPQKVKDLLDLSKACAALLKL
jgi:glycine/D-amino acid oxidase-like deaminating enzyme